MALDNDVTHFLTIKGRHPKVSKNTSKNLDAHFKGQSLCFYIVPSKTVVVVLLCSTRLLM